MKHFLTFIRLTFANMRTCCFFIRKNAPINLRIRFLNLRIRFSNLRIYDF
jgi:hypothetical protein